MRALALLLGGLAALATSSCGETDGGDRQAVAEPDPPTEPRYDHAPLVPEGTARALEALGYLPTRPTRNPEDRGVTTGGDDAASGLNLYSSRRTASARLIDASGEVVHRWQAEEEDRRWMHVEPLRSGAILAISKDRDLSKHAWGSELLWRRRMRAHHDLAVHPDGRLFALGRRRAELSVGEAAVPILADEIVVLSSEGEIERQVELVPILRDHLSARRLSRLVEKAGEVSEARLVQPGGLGDVLHTNSIAFLDVAIDGVAPAGSVLLSFRAISRVAILDAELTRVLWIWGAGELDGQHDATQIPGGNILLFDNGLRRGAPSRVVEVDPRTGRIAWSWSDPSFFTRLRGGAQHLRSGNLLLTESDRGHAIEITREGEVVWELWNPDVRGEGDRAERGVIYRLNRFPRSFFEPLESG